MKKYRPWIPEIYLILAVLFYWANTSSLINSVAITLLISLGMVVFRNNRVLGIIVASMFLILNFYMILALLSELSEFPEFNSDAQLLAAVGFSYLGLNLLLSVLMLRKWLRNGMPAETAHLTDQELTINNPPPGE